jgi:hypothetical protein
VSGCRGFLASFNFRTEYLRFDRRGEPFTLIAPQDLDHRSTFLGIGVEKNAQQHAGAKINQAIGENFIQTKKLIDFKI